MVVFPLMFSVSRLVAIFFFFSSRRRHTRWNCDWSSDVCSSDLRAPVRDCKAIQELGTSRRLQARAIAAANLLRAFAFPYGNSWRTRSNRFGGAGAGFTVLFSCPKEMETYPTESKMTAANPRITVM